MSRKTAVAIIGAVIVAIALAAIGWWVVAGNMDGKYYTRIDNARTEKLESRGGVIDPTGGMSLSYTLPSYDAQGHEKELSFGTERQLREGAYIMLTVEPIRGVVGWEEVRFDDLPAPVQKLMP